VSAAASATVGRVNGLAPRLIVGVDPRLTEGTEDALALAGALVAATGARVHLLCVYPWSAMSVDDEDMLRAAAERALAQARARLETAGVTHEAVPAREPAGALHEAATRGADLLIVGSSHRGRVGHALAGDVARSLLHGAPCPVAVAPHGYASVTHRLAVIGIAFTDTPAGRAALRVGGELAARAGAPLRAIGVAEPAELSIGRLYPEHERRELLLREMVARELGAALGRLDAPRADAVVRDGAPADVLARESETLDLLVTGAGAHGPGGLLLGSTTRHLLHDAACPLVIVPPGTRAFTAPG
jgi:nucleotide-binding universal stress UspA family protein